MLPIKNAMLIKELKPLILKYGNNSKIYSIIQEDFIKKGLTGSNAKNLLTGKLPLETLNINNQKELFLLFSFSDSMKKALNSYDEMSKDTFGSPDEYSKLNLENYFTELEIEEFKDFIIEKEEVTKYPYVLKNMLKVAEGHYVGIIDSQEFARIDASNDIVYEFSTQRDPKIDIFGMKRINTDLGKIDEMTDSLLTNNYFSDEIKLNVKKDGEDNLEFVSKDGIYGELIIHSGTITCFDGYHRKAANSNAANKNCEFHMNWKLGVTNFPEPRAKKFMIQVNKQKPIKREHIKNIDETKNENVIVGNIINNSNSELADKIKDSDADLKFGGLTKKSILSVAIEEQYKELLNTKIHNIEISNWIVDFMNYLMSLNTDAFIDKIEKVKEVSYINHKNIFMGYIALSKRVYGQDDWRNKTKEIINNIDFSIENDIWNNIRINDSILNKTSRKELYKLFLNEEV